MTKINDRLAEFSQTTRIIEMSATSLKLNNGTILLNNKVTNFVRRVMSRSVLDWVKNIDKLLAGEIDECSIKSSISSVGGRAVQAMHGDKIRKNLNNGTSWNAGTKGQNIGKKGPLSQSVKDQISAKNSGTGNGMYGVKMSDAEKAKRSTTMKDKILSGNFTPNSNNRNTHWESTFAGMKYRSSWEALYQCINPTAKYESFRIPYSLNTSVRIYIVDFIDYENHLVVEVKPKRLCNGDVFNAKMQALIAWAMDNEFNVLIADEEWLIDHPIQDDDLLKFDEKTIKKIKKLYEISKKNRN